MKNLIVLLALTLLSSPAWACDSYEECMGYADTGMSCTIWKRSDSPAVYTYSNKCPPNSGKAGDDFGCTCGPVDSENNYMKAIAYKLDEINQTLQNILKYSTGETINTYVVDPKASTSNP